MEPPVSVPREKNASPDETAAALPPDEPPGTLVKSYGFFVFLNAEFLVEAPMPNSSILSFPKRIESSKRSFFTAVAVKGGL